MTKYDFFQSALRAISLNESIWYTSDNYISREITRSLKKIEYDDLKDESAYFMKKGRENDKKEFTIIAYDGKVSRIWMSCPLPLKKNDSPISMNLLKYLHTKGHSINTSLPYPLNIREVYFRIIDM